MGLRQCHDERSDALWETLKGVGLYYGMQGAKVGWIADDKFDPQILADIQREARLGTEENVMQMVEDFGHLGYAHFLKDAVLVDTFVNTMKMEPHYGGWMHGVAHGRLPFENDVGASISQATSHDLNHLTVLSHDQTQPFMNDTFDYPQWPALDTPEQDAIDYFQAMVTLGDPKGDGLPVGTTGASDPAPVDLVPVEPVELNRMPDLGGGQDHGDDNVPDPMPATPAPTSAKLVADGPLSTSGNQIIDVNGDAVQIRAVNWFGAEGELFAPHGLWQRPMTDMMDQMVEEGFNAVRLPFSVEGVLENPVVSSVDGDPSLVGLRSLEVFDRIVDYADKIGLKIILDSHRVDAGNGADGIWYNNNYSEDEWIKAWETLAERYGNKPAVIGADLHNEPHYATWGGGGENDWAAAAEMAGNAVLGIAEDWLIVIEGVGTHEGDSYWWGGQLAGVRDRPIELDVDNKLVYSPHDYPASVFQQPWFTDGSKLYDVLNEHWGFIHEEGIAPVFLGEFGSKLETDLDYTWAEAITTYLSGDYDGNGTNDLADGEFGPSFAWWSWNPNSGDTGGILEDDWMTVRQEAVDLLEPLLSPAATIGNGATDPAPVNPTPVVPDPAPVDPDPTDPDMGGGHNHGDGHNHGGDQMPDTGDTPPPAVGGTVYNITGFRTITDFDPTMDKVDVGPDSIHNQIPVDTPEGLAFFHMFDPNTSLLLEGVNLADLQAGNFAPIADAHLQQDLSAALAWENGAGFVRENTIYLRSHEQNLEETVDFNPATDKISLFYVSVRGDQEHNYAVEETMEGVRFFSPITGQSLTLRDTQLSDLNSEHFEWRANQLEDNLAGRMGLADKIENFEIVPENVFSGKSVAMAGGVDRAPYHGQPDYTGIPRGKDDCSAPDPVDPMPVDPDPIPVDTDPAPVDPAPMPVDPGSPGPGAELDVSLEVGNDWGSGAIVELVITNPSATETVSGWDVTFDFEPGIQSVWTGVLNENDNGSITISNKDWNTDIAPGQTMKIGFQTISGRLDEAALNVAAGFTLEDAQPVVNSAPVDPVQVGSLPVDPAPVDPRMPPYDNSDVLDARFSVVDDWGSGATLELEISNVDQLNFEGGWELALNLDHQVTNAWNGTVAEGDMPGQVFVSAADWIADITGGQTVKVGIQVDEGNLDEEELNEKADFFFLL